LRVPYIERGIGWETSKKGGKGMKHIVSIFIKFLTTSVILEITIGLFSDLAIGSIFLISAVLTAVSYVVGDLLILRLFKNLAATLADIGLALLLIALLDSTLYDNRLSFLHEVIAAVAVGASEFIFHRFFAKRVLNRKRDK
jgi:hypothetical protein